MCRQSMPEAHSSAAGRSRNKKKMKMLSAILIVTVLLLGGAAWRWWNILPYPMGGGQHRDSPDGRYEARASTLYDEDFWGYKKHYYEFSIMPKASTIPAQTIRMDVMPGDAGFNLRTTNQVIHWAEDSKSVTFTLQNKEIKMNLEQAAGPYGSPAAGSPSGQP